MHDRPLSPTSPADVLSTRDGYAAWASCYDSDGNALIPLEQPAMWALFGPVQGRRALDLGCGTGRHTEALIQGGATVVAIDESPEMLARARRKLAGTDVGWVRLSLPARLPLRDASFDLVVMGLVAEHLPALESVLAEAARVLRSGGRCLLSALHPDQTATGQTARFLDPETGQRRPIATIHRTVADYLAAAAGAGLVLGQEQSLVVPTELAERYPRATRYVGRPLGWVAWWWRP